MSDSAPAEPFVPGSGHGPGVLVLTAGARGGALARDALVRLAHHGFVAAAAELPAPSEASRAQRAQVSRSEPQASEDHRVGERRPSDGTGGCELLGPAPAPLPRLRNRHRQQLLIKGERDAVQAAARAALAAAARLREGVSVAVDVRPWSML